MIDKIFGRHPVLEILKNNPKSIQKIFVAAKAKGHTLAEMLKIAKSEGIQIEFKDRYALDSMLGNDHHQGVIAEITHKKKTYEPIELIKIAKEKNEKPIILLLDRIQDPHNLGAVLRTSLCAGIHGVIITKDQSAGISSAVHKSSAGATSYIPITTVVNLAQTIEELKANGVWIIGTDPEAKKNYTEIDFKKGIGIVIGNEETGLRRLVKEKCDELIKIPVKGTVQSLNASVAAGIILYEIFRQRMK